MVPERGRLLGLEARLESMQNTRAIFPSLSFSSNGLHPLHTSLSQCPQSVLDASSQREVAADSKHAVPIFYETQIL